MCYLPWLPKTTLEGRRNKRKLTKDKIRFLQQKKAKQNQFQKVKSFNKIQLFLYLAQFVQR